VGVPKALACFAQKKVGEPKQTVQSLSQKAGIKIIQSW